MFTKKNHLILLAILVFSLPFSSVLADEKKKPPKAGGLSGNFSLGLNSTEGNTNLGRGNINFLVKYGPKQPGAIQHKLIGAYDYADRSVSRDGARIETKNDKQLSYKLDYNLSKHSHLTTYLAYEDNIKAKLESQKMIGVGYELADLGTKRHKFSLGFGVGNLSVDYTDGTPGFSGPALSGSLGYQGKLTKRFSVSTSLVVLAAEERTMTRSVSKLDYALSDRSSLVLKHYLTHFDEIPTTAIDKKDDITSLNVVFRF